MKFTADKVKGNISDTIYGSAFSALCRFNKSIISKNALVYCYFANEDDMSKISSVHANLSWQLLLKTHLSADLLAWERDNDSYIFVNQAIKHQKSTLASYQASNNLYGGPYGGMENYFSQIKSYFGQTKYDQMIQGFMRASSLYMDTIKLAEWHTYGSSRLGIYEANLHLASRSVRVESGTETQVNSTTVTYQSYTYFSTERGAKRFELTNHLGNVLAVITDKKVAICSTEVFAFWKAELVSATDYAPFGSPLAGRTYQASEYRFGFNSMEKDDETYGTGNAYDFGARLYDARLGRWFTTDIREREFPGLSPFNFCMNNPILFVDPNGEKPTPYEAALLAKHVYGDKVALAGGWRVSEKVIKDLVVTNLPSGFKAQLYEQVKEDGSTEYTYAFAGTESMKDVAHDVAQMFGLSKQYTEAFENAGIASEGLGKDELTFVGHSLGGGLAALASFKTGRAAITFNPAGVSTLTEIKHRTLFKTGKNVENYIAKIEPLNIFQLTALLPFGLTPNGKTTYIGGASHSINNSVTQLNSAASNSNTSTTSSINVNNNGSGIGMMESNPIEE